MDNVIKSMYVTINSPAGLSTEECAPGVRAEGNVKEETSRTKRNGRGKRWRMDLIQLVLLVLIWSWINHDLMNPDFCTYCPFIYIPLNFVAAWLIKFCPSHVFLNFKIRFLHLMLCSRFNYLIKAKQAPDIACHESPYVSQLSNPE